MLLEEGGSDISEIGHIFNALTTYSITSRSVQLHIDSVTFNHHTDDIFPLPITIPYPETLDKYTITLTSDCGMDLRTYRLNFVDNKISNE